MKSVLFVCVGNSCRSQMAEAFARQYGAHTMHAESAGLARATSIAPETSEVMREKGIDVSEQFPKDFEPCLAEKFDQIVNISGFLLPRVDGPEIREWEIEDPYGEDIAVHRKVRDEIERRVRELIAELELESGKTNGSPDGQRIAASTVRKPRLWQRFTKWR